jgi:O-methyltransferase
LETQSTIETNSTLTLRDGSSQKPTLQFTKPPFENIQLSKKAASFLLKHQLLVSHVHKEKKPVFDLVRKVKSETTSKLSFTEAAQIYNTARDTSKIPGDIAEVGVFMGSSAKLICEAKGNRSLHLFDTFEGLPELSEHDESEKFHEKQYSCSLERIKVYLQKYPNISYYKGLFPETSGPVVDTQFSFVHIDVDLYQSTKSCLEFFYPRLHRGGALISHDYVFSRGVRDAFTEYFENLNDPVIELAENQCIVVKS